MRKVYTKKGDEGYTNDYGGHSVPKDDITIVVLGKIDSVQSAIDLAVLKTEKKEQDMLRWVQKKLWQTSGEISCADEKCVIDPVTEKDLELLEEYVDSYGEPPQRFVRFNTIDAIVFNECRVRCRELETLLVQLLREKKLRSVAYKWLNRLSSLFFMMSYKAEKK